MPQYDESFLIDCAIGEKKKFRSYSITSATDENRKNDKKRKRWHSFKKRAIQPPQTHAIYRSLYSLIDINTDDTESICKFVVFTKKKKNDRVKISKQKEKQYNSIRIYVDIVKCKMKAMLLLFGNIFALVWFDW